MKSKLITKLKNESGSYSYLTSTRAQGSMVLRDYVRWVWHNIIEIVVSEFQMNE